MTYPRLRSNPALSITRTLNLPCSCRNGHACVLKRRFGVQALSKAWEGGYCDVLGKIEEVTQSEVQHVSGKHVLIGIKVRPQGFPTGLPMSVQ
jgi:hypothetical protein